MKQETKFKKAVYENCKKYGEAQGTNAIYNMIRNRDSRYFTRSNRARDYVESMPFEEFEDIAMYLYLESVYKTPEQSRDITDNFIVENFVHTGIDLETHKKVVFLNIDKLKAILRNIKELSSSEMSRLDINNLARRMKEMVPSGDGYEYDYWLGLISSRVTNYVAQEQLKGVKEEEAQNIQINPENLSKVQEKMITGLSPQVEGDFQLDETLYASIRVGADLTKNQEDAVLLVKDEELPNFKMMVVSDGVGGHEKGEVASSIVVKRLKEWFEGLSAEEKQCYYTGVSGLKVKLSEKINEIAQEVNNITGNKGRSYISMRYNR